MILRPAVLALMLALNVAPAGAQQQAGADQAATLADLRTQLRSLASELQGLRAELNASGAAGFAAAGGDSAIDRMNAMEAEIAALTGRTEQLQNRVNRIVTDGTRRIGDIEFRLCEMDPNCDLGALMTQPELGSLGGGAAVSQPAGRPLNGNGTPAASASEQADFDRAGEVLGQGDFRQAADLFAALAQTHAGGPLTSEALFFRGSALDSAGDPAAAASAWLQAFAATPDGPRAPESLLGLARIIASRGDPQAACLYLAEIPARFPGHAAGDEAQRRMADLGCRAAAPQDGAANPEEAADLADHG